MDVKKARQNSLNRMWNLVNGGAWKPLIKNGKAPSEMGDVRPRLVRQATEGGLRETETTAVPIFGTIIPCCLTF